MLTLGLIVALIAAISNGEWGPAAVAVVLLLFIFALLFGLKCGRPCMRRSSGLLN